MRFASITEFRVRSFYLSLALSFVSLCGVANAGQAHFILDARTGRVLASDHADSLNHPASLTKMMTLYMTFQALHAGKLSWSSKIRITKNAASKIPTKLGVRAGRDITVKEAVYGKIVLSANDAAAAMGDYLGGSEADFGRMMTRQAKRLGMSRTVFYNASGLPDMRQVTTARDMSTLAIALQRDFPNEYKLFSTKRFVFRGRVINGHNRLMYRYEGMDGIKTGYTNASGYNLVSSVRQGNRRVIGVVLGGTSAARRDAKMAMLLDKSLPNAKALKTSRLYASIDNAKSEKIAVASEEQEMQVPRAAPRNKADEVEVASIDDNADLREIITSDAAQTTTVKGDWAVQIAAADSRAAAMKLLAEAQKRVGASHASLAPYTEAVSQGSATLYRARFVNFGSRDQAKAACEALKQNDFSCLVISSR